MVSSDFADRKHKKLLLFDVDYTLSLPRRRISPDMVGLLHNLRKQVAIGFVSGSDLNKMQEQLADSGNNGTSFCPVHIRFTEVEIAQSSMISTSHSPRTASQLTG
ncbi:hypothetical protein EW145_g249 [Phellinidium pouzarii]|uniref:Phosphomannomutase n=1 Tax=Phellinidium pouzarii TaxID=167371 RepID=A0A4S4LJD1_9AGAM|nr:hypothetical protein EW145_g249 [Phellinidium pouzarii]